jgi:hypothetical protein
MQGTQHNETVLEICLFFFESSMLEVLQSERTEQGVLQLGCQSEP